MGAVAQHRHLAGDPREHGAGVGARRGHGAHPAQGGADGLRPQAVGHVLDGRDVGAGAAGAGARHGDAHQRGEVGAVGPRQHDVPLGGAGAGGLGERGGQARPLLLRPLREQGAAPHELLARDPEDAAEGVVHLHDRPVRGHDHQAVRQGRQDRGGALPLAGGGGDDAAHAAADAARAEGDGQPGGQVAGPHGAQQAVVGAGLEGRGGVGLGARLDQGDEVRRAVPGLPGGEQVGPEGLQAGPVGEDHPGGADTAAAHGIGVARARGRGASRRPRAGRGGGRGSPGRRPAAARAGARRPRGRPDRPSHVTFGARGPELTGGERRPAVRDGPPVARTPRAA